jgi:hypothetical protein
LAGCSVRLSEKVETLTNALMRVIRITMRIVN